MVCELTNPLQHPGRCAGCQLRHIVRVTRADGSEAYFCYDHESMALNVCFGVMAHASFGGESYRDATIISPDGHTQTFTSAEEVIGDAKR